MLNNFIIIKKTVSVIFGKARALDHLPVIRYNNCTQQLIAKSEKQLLNHIGLATDEKHVGIEGVIAFGAYGKR